MHIDVVGGGAIGLLFGGRLASAGAKVTVWTRSEEQAAKIRDEGIRLLASGGSEQLVPAGSMWIELAAAARETETDRQNSPFRVILLTVKQTDLNERLLFRLAELAAYGGQERTAIVCLQNGIGHMERIKSRLPSAALFTAVTTEGAKRLDARSVQHTGKGQLWLGKWNGNERNQDDTLENLQKMLVSLLESAGFTSFLSNDMENRIFNKLLINAVINPLTAMYDVTNGELPNHPLREALMRALHTETEQVLRAAGMTLTIDGWQLIIDVCKQTSGNVSSMLNDVRSGRATEIDAINGEIVRIADSNHLSAPLNKAITVLVQALYSKPDKRE
ncbi:ketopantoate reductase family protein [Paenibacillus alkaliterrae]